MEKKEQGRQHVRIDDRVLLRYRRLSPEEFREKVSRYQAGEEEPWVDPIRTPGEARRLNYHLQKLREKNRDLSEILEILALKLDRLLVEAKSEALKEFREVKVNISGAGIRFELDPLPEPGDIFEFDIGLLPEYHFVRAYGEVVRVEGREAAFKFIWITEEDVDRVVQHVFRKQLLQIQASRRAVKG